jgi:microcystin-dependent protein
MPLTPFVGQISLVGFNFEPQGWAYCDGRLLAIADYSVLFALIGTTYGGNGTTNFGLPDLRGRIIVGVGQGASLTNRVIGESAGTESVTVNASQMPTHTHAVACNTGGGTSGVPTGLVPAPDPGAGSAPYSGGAPDGFMSASAMGTTGQNQSHTNVQPYIALNYCISLFGVFPSQ